MSQKKWIILFVVSGCLMMAVVDGSAMDYVPKALLKITAFISLPLIYAKWVGKTSFKTMFIFKPKNLKLAFLLGILLYVGILILYNLAGSYFDLSALSGILDRNFMAGSLNFLPVAFYIAVINSFLEEFFFRAFAYLTLRKHSSARFAGIFSAVSFSLYHLFLMAGLFELWLYLLAVGFLVIAGVFFNALDHRSATLYPSWVLHFCANIGLNTIALVLLKIL